MPKLRKIIVDGLEFNGAPDVVRYLQERYGHGTNNGLRGALDRGASTYLGHALDYIHTFDDFVSSVAPNAPKKRGDYIPTHRYLGLPPLLRIPH